MKRWFLYACEQNYGGWHGINDMRVDEFDDEVTEEDIYKDYIIEMSLELMQSYDIDFGIEREDYDSDEEYDDALSEAMYENVDGYCKLIRDDVTLSTRELDEECCKLGEELFVEKYCVQEE